DGSTVQISARCIVFDEVVHDFDFSNTMVLNAYYGADIVVTQRYYSVGGGFIQWDGMESEDRGEVPYPYRNMKELKAQLAEHDLELHELIIRNEMASTGRSREDIREDMLRIMEAM